MANPSIRVLVVDDSALVRQLLTNVLSKARGIEVVGIARDGVEAVEAVMSLAPDVVTLDVQMPEMDGIEALRRIVRDSEARVVMLSSASDLETTYQALEYGAVDFISKPREGLATSLDKLTTELVKAIRTAYGVPPRKRLRPMSPAARHVGESRSGDPDRLVCIAASTGGPVALECVFSGLPQDASAAFLVVQHLPAGFGVSFAGRLARSGGFPVVEAENGMRVRSGHGYLAPHGTHMRINGEPGGTTRIELSAGPSIHGLKPSADPLFESVARSFGAMSVGVVLTGMGCDAARGMVALRAAGAPTIAQDEETSVVWGMPGAAVKAGAAGNVVPIDRVAVEIRRLLRLPGVSS